MSQKAETLFSLKVHRILTALEPDVWHQKISQTAIRGTPDYLLCARGWFVAWELKMRAGVVAPLQLYTLNRIERAGGLARVVYPDTLEVELRELQIRAGLEVRTAQQLETVWKELRSFSR